MWSNLKAKLDISSPVGKPLSPPTDSDLTQFEQRHRIPLPTSYCEFVKEFGPGELGAYFRIYAPAHGRRRSRADLAQLVEEFEVGREVVATAVNPKERDVVQALFPFCDSIAGDVIGWYGEDTVSGQERQIYVITRSATKVVKIADDFRAFIEEVCLGNAFGKAVKIKGWRVERTFTPYGTS